ncbi:MAG TPA: hypothetical protein VFA85_05590 [Terriglobales bacterium]|nr:hypothetical protein [Terriglobales bacterium]
MHTELKTVEPEAPAVPVGKAWRTVKSFIFWSYERGSVQYDVMVTIILLFVFFSPKLIDFNDRPVERNPHATGVVVYPDGKGEFIYQVDAKAVPNGDDSAVHAALLSVIEPISGSVSISHYETVKDGRGHIVAYRVWIQRE